MSSNQNQLWLAAPDQTVVSTALPTMAGDLGGLAYLSWVVTAYLLTSTVAGPLYGNFGDLYGRKIVLQVAIAVFPRGLRAVRHRAEHGAADNGSNDGVVFLAPHPKSDPKNTCFFFRSNGNFGSFSSGETW